jgi:hypothetical protein
MAPIILLALAAGAGYFVLKGGSKDGSGAATPATPTTPATTPATPATTATSTWAVPSDLMAKEAAAVAAGDPIAMRKVAAELRKLGNPDAVKAAESLEAAAAVIEAGQAAAKPTSSTVPVPSTPVIVATSPSLPQIATPTVTLPTPVVTVPTAALPAPVPQAPASPRRNAADALVRYLSTDPAYKTHDSQLESLMGSYVSTLGQSPTGGNLMYGPGTAKTLAEPESGGHTPPTPRYWPAGYAKYTAAIKNYEAWLRDKAAQDPARAAEWNSALSHARDYYPSGSKTGK